MDSLLWTVKDKENLKWVDHLKNTIKCQRN